MDRERALEERIMADEDYFRFKPTVEQKRLSRGGSLEKKPKQSVQRDEGMPEEGFQLVRRSLPSVAPSSPSPTGTTSSPAHAPASPSPSSGSLKRLPSISSLQQAVSVSSTFSSSPSSRPPAGLSSLRGPVTVATPPSGGSHVTPPLQPPTLAAMMSGCPEPAFLAYGRRQSSTASISSAGGAGSLSTSIGNPRIRRLSNLSAERMSPSPGSAGDTSPSSPARSHVPLRPAPAMVPSYGSFSPSTPSPLAQQLSMQGDAESSSLRRGFRHTPSTCSATGSIGRQSLLHASKLPMGEFPSLRVVFSGYSSSSRASASITNLSKAASGILSAPASVPGASSNRPIPTVGPRAILRTPSIPPEHLSRERRLRTSSSLESDSDALVS
ncbi:hypothetical protein K437DRAFT_80776 [Tilletiaria anomala UBC 951]|uniref:Uncharacterized protein n=1 Tax=Tilletiaria anomala (strain ATCC 24038 / CBS 436.72 / UBC 951) TaxID=1037660 RepID=A0A066V8Z4_TILAU|nr:uncharacterized protein K437DRAFT_80776 [Tilletiaria anomala UBC 951]KDN35214.1 hypothetical protein K437DRAFT_80776 [Tilletiaria anomala UBC 951]